VTLTDTVRTRFGAGTFGRYAAIGISGITLDFLLFALLVALGVAPLPATVVSTLAGIVNNYVLNARTNFGTGLSLRTGWRFITVGLVGLVLAAALLELLLRLGLGPLPAKLVSIPCVVVAQFFANKHWTFRA
jgi:putative flippase GtrA